MTKKRKKETPKSDVEIVLAAFDAKEDVLTAFCAKTRSLIEAILRDAGIRYQSVQARVKNKAKLREKYLDPEKEYKVLDDITDLAGLRIITYYEDDVDRVAQMVKKEFQIDSENSIDKRETEPDRFGYSALNYVCTHLPQRIRDVEYKQFAGVCCEIQITSILRHAWAEIEHEWYDLKEAYPGNIKRRFYRTAALLELAESEFLEIRKKRTDYQRSVAVQVEAKVPDLALDTISMKSFIQQDPTLAVIDESIAKIIGVKIFQGELDGASLELRSKAARIAGCARVEDIRTSMTKYGGAIIEYVTQCRKFWIIGRDATLGRGFSILALAMMLVAVQGETQAAEVMAEFSVSVAFNRNVRAQIDIAREIIAKYAD